MSSLFAHFVDDPPIAAPLIVSEDEQRKRAELIDAILRRSPVFRVFRNDADTPGFLALASEGNTVQEILCKYVLDRHSTEELERMVSGQSEPQV